MKLLTAAPTKRYEVQVTETVTRVYTKLFEAVSAAEAEEAANGELDEAGDSLDLRDVDWQDTHTESLDQRDVSRVREVR